MNGSDKQPMAFTSTRREVSFGECDVTGIVYNPNFLRWFDDNVHRLLKLHLGSFKTLQVEHDLEGLPIVETNLRFHAPLRYEMAIEIQSWIEELGRRSLVFRHQVIAGDTVTSEATEVRVWVAKGMDGRPPTAAEIPEGVRVRLEPQG